LIDRITPGHRLAVADLLDQLQQVAVLGDEPFDGDAGDLALLDQAGAPGR
jgi:hypothetical protein